MRYVLPALPVSGPSSNRARRCEAARLAQRQGARGAASGKRQAANGKTQDARRDRLLRRLILQNSFALREQESGRLSPASAMLTKQQATELQQEFSTHHDPAELHALF
jgi:hypothetical protein